MLPTAVTRLSEFEGLRGRKEEETGKKGEQSNFSSENAPRTFQIDSLFLLFSLWSMKR